MTCPSTLFSKVRIAYLRLAEEQAGDCGELCRTKDQKNSHYVKYLAFNGPTFPEIVHDIKY